MENKKLQELQRNGQSIKYEKEYIRKNGTRVPIELLVHLVKNDDGSPKFYYSFITEITERKKSEKLNQELFKSEKHLREKLQLSNEELKALTEELRISNKELKKQGNNLLKINQNLEESEEKFLKAFHAKLQP
jgi:hypothetical protein